MPTNKNASFRYRVLDHCFQNRFRQWTLEALVQKVSDELRDHHNISKGIKKRQIQDDIRIMRSDPPLGYEAPIDCKNGCYFYSDPTFSIEKKALNTQDMNHLGEALSLLRQFRGVPHFRDIERILLKMEGKVRYYDPGEEIIAFEQIELVKGSEHIPKLYEAIRDQQSLIIDYLPFQAIESLRLEAHPYYLKEYRGRWYVFGWIKEWTKVANLALDRVDKMTPCRKAYRHNTDFDPATYFGPIVGVTLQEGGSLQTIKIKVSSISAPYVRTKLIHTSQEEIKVDDHSIFTFNIIPNYEFEAELLRLGEAVEVLEPEEFREKIRERLIDALKNY
ncbi:WYL domain-containing protein [Spirosoma sp. SC4-14]|uniref:helix-turn-helix transcriptional regulator n=1 Tax=Spirosoma sp. SC4-14 TaxID=3128900 RepID=UPI0030CD6457